MLGEILHSESAQPPGPPRRAPSASLGRPLASREAGGALAALVSKRGGRNGWRDGGGGRRAGSWQLAAGRERATGGSGRVLSDARSRLSVCPQAVSGPGRASFPFPYTPYRIQEQFMAALYAALEAGRVGIFESPTGTVSSGSEGGIVTV